MVILKAVLTITTPDSESPSLKDLAWMKMMMFCTSSCASLNVGLFLAGLILQHRNIKGNKLKQREVIREVKYFRTYRSKKKKRKLILLGKEVFQ